MGKNKVETHNHDYLMYKQYDNLELIIEINEAIEENKIIDYLSTDSN